MDELALNEIAAAAGGQLIRGATDAANCMIRGISTDTRTLESGQLFIPLIGERFDGHRFLAEARRAGAAASFVARDRYNTVQDWLSPMDGTEAFPLILVENTLAAMHALARYYRSHFQIPVIAVTGSNGKTTTKDMIYAILKRRFRVLSTQGNFNNEVGLPLTLFSLECTHEAAVLEMGMRGLGEIARLCSMAQPTVGVVTNVAAVHLERLHTMENIAQAKSELVEAIPASGHVILNCDDERVRAMQARTGAPAVLYGLGDAAQVRAENVETSSLQGTSFDLVYGDHMQKVQINVPGRHNVYNALAAAAASLIVGCDLDDVVAGIAAFEPSARRMAVVEIPDGITVIDDCYNASPLSMASALETLAMAKGRRIAVLGDMLELGAMAPQAHFDVGKKAGTAAEVLVAVGEFSGSIAEGARTAGLKPENIATYVDAAAAAAALYRRIRPGDVVLVKASRGVRLEQVVETLTEPGGRS